MHKTTQTDFLVFSALVLLLALMAAPAAAERRSWSPAGRCEEWSSILGGVTQCEIPLSTTPATITDFDVYGRCPADPGTQCWLRTRDQWDTQVASYPATQRFAYSNNRYDIDWNGTIVIPSGHFARFSCMWLTVTSYGAFFTD